MKQHEIYLEGTNLPMSNNVLWDETCTKMLHKDHESTNVTIKTTTNKNDDKHRRHNNHGTTGETHTNGKGHNTLPLRITGPHSKLCKVSIKTRTEARIPRDRDQQSNDESEITRKKVKQLKDVCLNMIKVTETTARKLSQTIGKLAATATAEVNQR